MGLFLTRTFSDSELYIAMANLPNYQNNSILIRTFFYILTYFTQYQIKDSTKTEYFWTYTSLDSGLNIAMANLPESLKNRPSGTVI